MTKDEAFELAARVHQAMMEDEGRVLELRMNYLKLECLGTVDLDSKGLWAASFDSVIGSEGEDWFENENIVSYPFAARADSPEKAIRLAAEKALAALKESYEPRTSNAEVKADPA